MDDVRAVPPNGLGVVSTFSGCGGSCLGFRLAGFRTLWASEFVPAARETYAANFPDVPLDGRDLREVDPAEILAAIGRDVGDVDVLEGSPPCASFSMAGKRNKKWGQVAKYSDVEQRVDDLFDEFVRILRGLRPRAFVAENVPGLAAGKAKGFYLAIRAALADSGYRVGARVLDAQWLGVPQRRARLIFVGVRTDLAANPPFPKPLPYRYSLADALPDLAGARTRGGRRVRSSEPAPTVQTHGREATRSEFTPIDPSIEDYAIGREAEQLNRGEQSRRYFSLVRPRADEPCPTVTQTGGNPGAASVIHPSGKRKFTIEELRRVFAIPADFVLTGTFQQQWERLGRCVPPPVSRAVAEALAPVLLAR